MLIFKNSRPKLQLPYILYNGSHRKISWFGKIKETPPDAIFGLLKLYKADKFDKKVNLCIGIYRDMDGKPFVLDCVKKAEKRILQKNLNKDYIIVEGSDALVKHTMDFTFGKNNKYYKEGRHVTVQSLAGSGGMSLAAQFLSKFYPGKKCVYIGDPTWANHHNLFNWHGLQTNKFRYFDPKKMCLDFKGMLDDIRKIPNKSIILLQSCCHNPTGVDLNVEQWKLLADVVKQRELYVIFDNAYQGFASGDCEKDACPFRIFAQACINFAISTSFSKVLGLYSERVGCLSFIIDDKSEFNKILSNLYPCIRANHSNPPAQGTRIVEEIFEDSVLKDLWKCEFKVMYNRLKKTRQMLVAGLRKAGSTKNWDMITKQVGMFSYIGLKPNQVKELVQKYHIYITEDGRIAIPGVNINNINYVCECIHKVVK